MAGGIANVIYSSTAVVYGEPAVVPVPEDPVLAPINPYGRSTLMSEWMLADAAHGFSYLVLRYVDVAGADPRGRSGRSTANATRLIEVATRTALGRRPLIEVFGTDYPTPDGSCLRGDGRVSDLADAHLAALRHLRSGGRARRSTAATGAATQCWRCATWCAASPAATFLLRYRRGGQAIRRVSWRGPTASATLGWPPRHDNLDGIVRRSLEWEEALPRRNLL